MKIQVNDLEELRYRAGLCSTEVVLCLNHDCISRKHVFYDVLHQVWTVYNEIDGTTQYCSDKDLETLTNIVEAIDKEALYYEEI